MPKLNQKGIAAQLIILVILLMGLGIGIYLVQKTQTFRPQASSTDVQFLSSSSTSLKNGQSYTTSPTVSFKLTSPLETNQTSDAGDSNSTLADTFSLVKPAFADSNTDEVYDLFNGYADYQSSNFENIICDDKNEIVTEGMHFGILQVPFTSQLIANCNNYTDENGQTTTCKVENSPKVTSYSCIGYRKMSPPSPSEGQGSALPSIPSADLLQQPDQFPISNNYPVSPTAPQNTATSQSTTNQNNSNIPTAPSVPQNTSISPSITNPVCPEVNDPSYTQCGQTVGLLNFPATHTVEVTPVKDCHGNIIRYENKDLNDLGLCGGSGGSTNQGTFVPQNTSTTPSTTDNSQINPASAKSDIWNPPTCNNGKFQGCNRGANPICSDWGSTNDLNSKCSIICNAYGTQHNDTAACQSLNSTTTTATKTTINYRFAEDINSIQNQPWKTYTPGGVTVDDYTFSNVTPGPKFIFAQFQDNQGNTINADPYPAEIIYQPPTTTTPPTNNLPSCKTTTICGQSVTGNSPADCTFSCENGHAKYTCIQSDNPQYCKGTIYCSSEDATKCGEQPCNATGTYCGQTVYDHLSPVRCVNGQAFYDSYQTNNPDNCKGTIQCEADNDKCSN